MRKLLLTCVSVVSLLMMSMTTAFAATVASEPTQGIKIGVINIQDLLQKSPQMKTITADLKKQFGDRESKIMTAQNNFKKEADDYKRNSAVMADKDRKAAEQKLIVDQQNLQQMQMAFQQDFVAAQNKEINALLARVKSVVDKIAADGKYSLILTNSSVAYVDSQFDITNQVLQELAKTK